jgi:hypothetical protein
MSEPPPDPQALDEEFLDTTFEEADGDESDEYEFEDGDGDEEQSDDDDEEYEEDATEGERSRSLTALLIADRGIDVNATVNNPTEGIEKVVLEDVDDDEEYIPDTVEKSVVAAESKKRKIEADDQHDIETEITAKKAKENV